MPDTPSGPVNVMRWIACYLPKNTYVNIMAQYTPVFQAHRYPEINLRINIREYREVVNAARNFGLKNLDVQGAV